MQQAAFGTWQSPVSASMATGKTVAFCDVVLEGEAIYWSEMRPEEGGRCALLKWTPSHPPIDVLPPVFNVRTKVHEYGGAAFAVYQGVVYFIHFSDQRLYRAAPGEMPKALTPENIRFAEMSMTAFGLVAIAESHQTSTVKNFLALIHPETGEVRELACGHDFYASPTVSSDNQKIAFIAWDHPNMPWDNTMLFVGNFSGSGISHLRQIESDFLDQSFFQPTFGPSHELVVASDKSNWWNLYQVEGERLIPLFSVESEIGQPLWQLGASRFAFYQGGILCTYEKGGKASLYHFKNKSLTPLQTPYSHFSQIKVNAHHAVFLAGAPDKPTALICLDNNQKLTVIKTSAEFNINPGYYSFGQHITFPSDENRESYAYFYPPQNKDYVGLKNTLPPLIVKSHGGPTAHCDNNLNLEIQYWTSRGFAFVDVNYTGSAGYGRAYRKRLEGNWGIFDVKDCEAAALFLVKEGLVDKNKLAITGRSAGGYTALAALTFTDTFHVGASLYGISDLALLTKETHKFESRYLDRLIGPYPQEKQKYLERSPVNHVEKLSKPVIFFQGDEDRVVPPKHAERLYHALKEKGIKTKYCLFQGEQHGFRKAENRISVLEEMRQFFLEVI